MARVFPFRGIMFNKSMKNQLGDFLCPPFDVISEGLKKELYDLSEYNVIRLENGRIEGSDNEKENKYTRASDLFNGWLKNGTLIQSDQPCFFILEESFEVLGNYKKRRSLISSVDLYDYEEKVVLPHEKTRKKQKHDRFQLMKTTNANFSPIMSAIEDKDKSLINFLIEETSSDPEFKGLIPNMHEFKIWIIDDEDKISFLTNLFDGENIYIADGHHRYETALEYKKLIGKKGSKRMMNLISMNDEGLLLLGYHRAFSGLNDEKLDLLNRKLQQFFIFSDVKWEESFYESNYSDEDKIIMVNNNNSTALSLKENLNSTYEALHAAIESVLSPDEIINHIRYEHDSEEMKRKLDSNDLQLCFFMNALSKNYFIDMVSRGKLLPPKSTLFYPKLPTGLVIQYLNDI
ncbi:MAG: DUF1015 domain-containing protein [Chloroflexota bacterium]|nr:DUF1015 domain-containing protein [Chloroflexota bacterium]